MNDVKICGDRGLCTFCPICQDWTPIRTEVVEPVPRDDPRAKDHDGNRIQPPPLQKKTGGFCHYCEQRLPTLKPYNKPPEKEAPSAR